MHFSKQGNIFSAPATCAHVLAMLKKSVARLSSQVCGLVSQLHLAMSCQSLLGSSCSFGVINRRLPGLSVQLHFQRKCRVLESRKWVWNEWKHIQLDSSEDLVIWLQMNKQRPIRREPDEVDQFNFTILCSFTSNAQPCPTIPFFPLTIEKT